ncbi:hypothetical protein KCP78_10695 [Salmonella enterica subsp. enterica]|nr:hypothetical protein KCP78_10695 [Salmonella enterica subsp. enterica]
MRRCARNVVIAFASGAISPSPSAAAVVASGLAAQSSPVQQRVCRPHVFKKYFRRADKDNATVLRPLR